MAQESYADYSIIHKYFQQERLHEEELQKYRDETGEMQAELEAARQKADQAVKDIQKLKDERGAMEQEIKEKDNEIMRLNTTIQNLQQKIAQMTRGGR